MTGGSRWCPSCGDEFETWVVACNECDVDLVDAEPEKLKPVERELPDGTRPSRVCPECGDEFAPRAEMCFACEVPLVDVIAPDGATTPPMRVESDALSDADRAALLAHLEAAPIPHFVAEDGSITAVPGYEDDLDLALQRVRGGTSPSRLRYAEPLAEGRPLSSLRRVTSIAIDGLVAGLATGIAWQLDVGGLGALMVLTSLFANQVVGMKERGLSVGKFLVGARLRSVFGGGLSWPEATVRWLLKDGLTVATVSTLIVMDDPGRVWVLLEIVGFCWVVGLAGSIMIDLQRRGVHDFAVDSVVVSAASVSNWPADGAKSGT